MPDFYEIDFLPVHTSKSGDAIAMRYQIGANWWVHVVDGGFTSTAPDLANLIRQTYGTNLINWPMTVLRQAALCARYCTHSRARGARRRILAVPWPRETPLKVFTWTPSRLPVLQRRNRSLRSEPTITTSRRPATGK